MPKSKKSSARLKTPNFSKTYLLIFLAIFAVGGYAIYRTFAASPTPGLLEAESMASSTGVTVFNDEGASGGQAVLITQNNKLGLIGQITIADDPALGMQVVARSIRCQGISPSFTLTLSNSTFRKSFRSKVRYIGWRTYQQPYKLTIPANQTYNVALHYSTYSNLKKCQTKLFIDAVKLLIPPVTITLPTNVDPATNITSSKARLNAALNTKGKAVNFYFEYGPTTTYGSKTKLKAAKIKKGTQIVSKKVNKLTPATTYHFRLCVIIDSTTPTCGPDASFTTKAAD